MPNIYLDHNATAPVRPEVRIAVAEALSGEYGNPSSIHRPGHRAKILLESARASVARLLGARPHEILFTSGGTEANNLALLGAAAKRGDRGHVIVSRVEHSSVLEPARALEQQGLRISRIPPSPAGRVDPDQVLRAVTSDTFLVSLMHSSNELGTLQPVEEVACGLSGRGVLLHTDAVQSAGKVPLDVHRMGVDLLSLSAHKIGGPQGVGCLWIRDSVTLAPLLLGGAQETYRRAGTEPLPLIAGFGVAATLADEELPSATAIRELRDWLEEEMGRRFENVRFHGRAAARVPNTLSAAFPGTGGEELVMALDLEGVSVSTGSACAAGTVRPSHVLEAIGCSREEARATLRISLGRGSSRAELEGFMSALARVLDRSRGGFARGASERDSRSAAQAVTVLGKSRRA